MTYQLALDCSTSRGSVTLADAVGARRWQVAIPAGRGHGGQLFSALERALGEIRATNGKLARIVVGLGPGSYSGVRQTVAAAVGLAAATGADLVGAPSALVLGAPGDPEMYHAVSDARRGTFYHTVVSDGVCIRGPELLPDATALATCIAEYPDGPVFVVESCLPNGLLAVAPVVFPESGRLLRIPEKSCRLPPLEPIYLRPVSVTFPKSAVPVVP